MPRSSCGFPGISNTTNILQQAIDIPSLNKIMQQTIEISEPAKHLRISANTQVFSDRKYTYFIAEKNNERFLGHHTRFFILLQDSYSRIKEFGYARELPAGQRIPFGQESLIPQRKMSLLIENIKELKYNNEQSIQIAFTHNGRNITWQIKCDNQRMAENVYHLLYNAKNSIVILPPNEAINQTEETLMPPNINPQQKSSQQKKQQNKPIAQETPFANTNQRPPAIDNSPGKSNTLGQSQQITNTLGSNLGSILNSPGAEINAKQSNQSSHLRPFTLAANQQPEQKLEVPLTNVSLLSMAQQNQKQKEHFVKKVEEHKAKQEGTVPKFTLNTTWKDPLGNVTEDMLRSQSEALQKRQTVISNQNELWNYQFLKGNEENLVFQFKHFTENFICELIDSLCLPDSQRLYRPVKQTSLYHQYEVQGLKIRLCYTGISEIKLLKNSKDTVYDEKAIKEALRQFKNMDYLLSTTRNRGKIRLPLANIVEYKGIVALVKAEIEADERQQAISLFNEFDLISKEARVKKQVFADPRSLRILPLQSKKYEKHNRVQSSTKKSQPSFDVFYLDDVKHFLPADFNFVQKDPQNNILRAELLQHEDLDGKQLMGLSVQPFLSRNKTERGIQQSFQELEAVSKDLLEAANNLLDQWQGLEEITMTSKEVEKLFHKHGVNMRYLGMLYDKATVPLIRKICMSEMAARVAKVILRARLQQVIRSYADSMTPKEIQRKDKLIQLCQCNQMLISIVVDFLNEVASENSQSQSTWKTMNKQAQHNFNTPLSKLQVSEPYLLQALIHSCNIKFDWSKFPKNANLFRGKLFRRNMISGFDVRSKNYNLNFTDLYTKINLLLAEDTPESAQQLKSILNLKKLNIPEHFKMNGLYERIARMLSTYVQPKYLEASNNSLPCTSIYEMIFEEPPSYTSISLAIMQIKWVLKYDNINKAQKLLKELVNKVSEWSGDVHPVLTEIYSMFAQYYLLKGEFEEAANHSKSALANQTKILGGAHQKIAERYYELAQIWFNSSRKQDSLANYRKAKNICDNANQVDTVFYAEVCYKIALLSLQLNKLSQAEAQCRTAVEIFEMNRGENGSYQKQSVNCYELLMRIYEVWGKREDMEKISFYCGECMQDFKEVSNLEKVLRVYLIPYLLGVKRKQAQRMVALFQQIPLQLGASSYSTASTYIRKLIESGNLLPTIEELFANFNEIYDEVVGNSILTRWRGFEAEGKTPAYQCIAVVEALMYFLGEGFVMGALKQS